MGSDGTIMKICRQLGNSKIKGTWVARVRYYEAM